MRTIISIAAAPICVASPALAHPGGHGRMSFLGLLAHLAEPFHAGVLVAAVVAITVVCGLMQRRSLEARRKAPRDLQVPHDR